jgi:hypothetical protein
MGFEVINIGAFANSGTGDSLRAAFGKAKNNFAALDGVMEIGQDPDLEEPTFAVKQHLRFPATKTFHAGSSINNIWGVHAGLKWAHVLDESAGEGALATMLFGVWDSDEWNEFGYFYLACAKANAGTYLEISNNESFAQLTPYGVKVGEVLQSMAPDIISLQGIGGYTVQYPKRPTIILVDSSSGNKTLTLPSSGQPVQGIPLTIKKISQDANTISVVAGEMPIEGGNKNLIAAGSLVTIALFSASLFAPSGQQWEVLGSLAGV